VDALLALAGEGMKLFLYGGCVSFESNVIEALEF
jgi:hypothetical protein